MRSVGIRDAKAGLSKLVRAAVNGEPILLTDYHRPLAVITSLERGGFGKAASDPAEFRGALLALPYVLEVDF
jgi:prevent-host-death family protein